MIKHYIRFRNYEFSPLILGTVQLGMDYGISNTKGKPAFSQGINLLNYAIGHGINTFDTARKYGTSENLIGKFLANKPQGSPLHIITKFALDPEVENDLEKCWDQASLSVRQSLNLLGVSSVCGCLFHRAPANNLTRLSGILPVIFDRLKEEGMIGFGGLSAYYPADVETTLEIPQIEMVQVPFNLFDQRLLKAGLLRAMKIYQKLVIARSVFLQGLFFLEPESLTGNLLNAGKYLSLLRQICRDNEWSISQLAFSFVRDQPDIDCLVIGAADLAQVRENIDLLDGPSLSSAMKDFVDVNFQVDDEIIITPGLWQY